jgi:ribosomal protein S18 acetylase RimI-like enzyme
LNLTFREINTADISLHKEFIYLALWDHPDEERRPRAVLEDPKIRAYYEGWGHEGDLGFIAHVDEQATGFIQVRVKYSPTEHYVDFPELAIAVCPKYQGFGIGSKLINVIIERLKGVSPGIRLGVHPKNEGAINLYKKFDFEFYEHLEGLYPQMVLKFASNT